MFFVDGYNAWLYLQLWVKIGVAWLLRWLMVTSCFMVIGAYQWFSMVRVGSETRARMTMNNILQSLALVQVRSHTNEEKVICFQLELADVSTEYSSCHQGESEEVQTNIAFQYSHALLRIHIIGGQRSVRIAPPSILLQTPTLQKLIG